MSPEEMLHTYSTMERAVGAARFFKTGPGQYGEGDIFMGVTVPDCRIVARHFKDISLRDARRLLRSPIHECRLTALIILVNQFSKASEEHKKYIYDLYIANTKYINNWDLVDTSASYIVGQYLGDDYKTALTKLASSNSLWERRIAVLATFWHIKHNNPAPAFEIIDIVKNDQEDLIHKANGWMLREIGKNSGKQVLVDWLVRDKQYQRLPRTTFRYAIEHFTPDERQRYLKNLV